MKLSIFALVMCTIKIFIMWNSAKDIFSNFYQQQLANHPLFLITCFINKFTNIPLNETINNCVSDLHNQNFYNGELSKRDLFKLQQTATSESSFVFDYLLYKQVDGVAMGSPLDPTLANAFLCHYEKEWLNNCSIHFKPVIYKRYVNDIFVLFHLKNTSQLFVDYMNKQHICLKFTSDAEDDTLSRFWTLTLPIITNNLKDLFIENQLSVLYLRTMKVMWIKHKRSH